MPEKSGFDLLEELTAVPEVVFTTAYNQYAVKAFEVNALDYIVKPLREERFAMTMEKVKTKLLKIRKMKNIYRCTTNICQDETVFFHSISKLD